MTIRLSIARATRASGRQCQPVPAAVATNAVSVALAVRPPPRGDPPVPSAPLSRLSRRAARAATRQRRDGRPGVAAGAVVLSSWVAVPRV